MRVSFVCAAAAVAVCAICSVAADAVGTAGAQAAGNDDVLFWQVTDIHYEPGYCVGCKTKDFCRAKKELDRPRAAAAGPAGAGAGAGALTSDEVCGYWGTYVTDIPFAMAESAVEFVSKMSRSLTASTGRTVPILWTGDSGPHKLDEDNSEASLAAVVASTELLLSRLPVTTTVLPVLGNLDVFPNGQLKDSPSTKFLNVIADAWAPWLDVNAEAQFRSTGYYAQTLPELNVTVLALNTVLWFKENALSRPKLSDDPLGQFDWVEARLAAAHDKNQKIILMGHIPPQDFHSGYNARFVKILRKYADAVYATVFAHWHENMFSLLWDHDAVAPDLVGASPIAADPLLVQYSSSSITSRNGRNPAVRLYSADADAITDFTVFRTNLTAALAANATSWGPFYSAKDAYSLPDLSPKSWHNLYLELYAGSGLTSSTPVAPAPCATGDHSMWKLFAEQHVIANDQSCGDSCSHKLLGKMECVDMTTAKWCADVGT